MIKKKTIAPKAKPELLSQPPAEVEQYIKTSDKSLDQLMNKFNKTSEQIIKIRGY